MYNLLRRRIKFLKYHKTLPYLHLKLIRVMRVSSNLVSVVDVCDCSIWQIYGGRARGWKLNQPPSLMLACPLQPSSPLETCAFGGTSHRIIGPDLSGLCTM